MVVVVIGCVSAEWHKSQRAPREIIAAVAFVCGDLLDEAPKQNCCKMYLVAKDYHSRDRCDVVESVLQWMSVLS